MCITSMSPDNPRVCHISTLLPTQCGIATFTHDLVQHIGWNAAFVRMLPNSTKPIECEPEVSVNIDRLEDYERACHWINSSNIDLVCIQHEFGIFGGPDGEFIRIFLRGIKRPIVTTIHTLSAQFPTHRADIFRVICERSAVLVVPSAHAHSIVGRVYGVPEFKMRIIHHGVPSVSFVEPTRIPLRQHIEGYPIIVSAGHLRRAKGYEISLQALAQYRPRNPNFKFIIIGADHPEREESAVYRAELEQQISMLGLDANVIWVKRYLDQHDLLEHIQAADLGLATYTRTYQISSGMIPMMLACGRPVVASPFDYSVEAANRNRGMFVAASDNPSDICSRLGELAGNPIRLADIRMQAYQDSRADVWRNAASAYRRVFRSAVAVST